MGQLLIDGMEVVTPDDFSFDIIEENPVFRNSEKYTYDIEIDLELGDNAKIYSFINRPNTVIEQKNRRAVYIDNLGRVLISGIEKIIEVSATTVSIIIAAYRSEFNSIVGEDTFGDIDLGEVEVYDFIESGIGKGKSFFFTDEWICAPCIGQKFGREFIYNNYGFNEITFNQSLEYTFTMTDENTYFHYASMANGCKFWYLSHYLKKIFEYYGFTYISPQEEYRYKYVYIMTLSWSTKLVDRIPKKQSVKQFLKDCEYLYGIEFQFSDDRVVTHREKIPNNGSSFLIEPEDFSINRSLEEDYNKELLKYSGDDSNKYYVDRYYISKEDFFLRYEIVEFESEIPENYPLGQRIAHVKKSDKYYCEFHYPGGTIFQFIGLIDSDGDRELCFMPAAIIAKKGKISFKMIDDADRTVQAYSSTVYLNTPVNIDGEIAVEQEYQPLEYLESDEKEKKFNIIISQFGGRYNILNDSTGRGILQPKAYFSWPTSFCDNNLVDKIDSYGDNLYAKEFPIRFQHIEFDYPAYSLRINGEDGLEQLNNLDRIDQSMVIKAKFQYDRSMCPKDIFYCRGLKLFCKQFSYKVENGDIKELADGDFFTFVDSK